MVRRMPSAGVLFLAAIAGRQLCSLGVLDRTVNRWAVGIGMIPRVEVGLIFASIGASLGYEGEKVIVATTNSAVFMVIVTTLVTPPLLKWTLADGKPPGRGGNLKYRGKSGWNRRISLPGFDFS